MKFWAIGRLLSERTRKPTQMKLYKILKSFKIERGNRDEY